MSAKTFVRVCFNKDQTWETIAEDFDPTERCGEPLIPGRNRVIDYTCHCWATRLETWEGTPLKLCSKHSAESQDAINTASFTDEGEGSWAAFTNDGSCYDLCWMETKETLREVATKAVSTKADAPKALVLVPIAEPVLLPIPQTTAAWEITTPFSKFFNATAIEEAHARLREITTSIEEETHKLVVLTGKIAQMKSQTQILGKEPLYLIRFNLIRKLEDKRSDEITKLMAKGLSQEAALRETTIKDLTHRIEKTQAELATWVSQIGKSQINARLADAIAEQAALTQRLSLSREHIRDDLIVPFSIIFEGYLNVPQDKPELKAKYRKYLELYKPYFPEDTWAATYKKRHDDLKAQRRAVQASKSDRVTQSVSMQSELAPLVIRTNGTVQADTAESGVVIKPLLGVSGNLGTPTGYVPRQRKEQRPPVKRGSSTLGRGKPVPQQPSSDLQRSTLQSTTSVRSPLRRAPVLPIPMPEQSTGQLPSTIHSPRRESSFPGNL